jgi:hypothetical protein
MTQSTALWLLGGWLVLAVGGSFVLGWMMSHAPVADGSDSAETPRQGGRPRMQFP